MSSKSSKIVTKIEMVPDEVFFGFILEDEAGCVLKKFFFSPFACLQFLLSPNEDYWPASQKELGKFRSFIRRSDKHWKTFLSWIAKAKMEQEDLAQVIFLLGNTNNIQREQLYFNFFFVGKLLASLVRAVRATENGTTGLIRALAIQEINSLQEGFPLCRFVLQDAGFTTDQASHILLGCGRPTSQDALGGTLRGGTDGGEVALEIGLSLTAMSMCPNNQRGSAEN